MSGDLDGKDAFDKLLEVALDSRVDVRRAQDERDHARSAQRDAERLAAERQVSIRELEAREQQSLPRLQELWEAAEALRDEWIRIIADGTTSPPVVRLSEALAASKDYCNQPPF